MPLAATLDEVSVLAVLSLTAFFPSPAGSGSSLAVPSVSPGLVRLEASLAFVSVFVSGLVPACGFLASVLAALLSFVAVLSVGLLDLASLSACCGLLSVRLCAGGWLVAASWLGAWGEGAWSRAGGGGELSIRLANGELRPFAWLGRAELAWAGGRGRLGTGVSDATCGTLRSPDIHCPLLQSLGQPLGHKILLFINALIRYTVAA